MRFLILFLLLAPGHAQSMRWFRAHTRPSPFEVSSCTNSTPVVCTTKAPHQLQVGDHVVIHNGRVDNGGGAMATVWASANGHRKVRAVTSNTLTLTDTADVPVVGNGDWTTDTYSWQGITRIQGPVYGVRVDQYPVSDHPRNAYFDGLTGIRTRRIATNPTNGLTSLAVSGGVATVTLAYHHGMATGNMVGVFNSLGGSLDGNKLITVTGAQTFTFPTVAANGGYVTTNTTISQYAHSNNQWWTQLSAQAGMCSPTGSNNMNQFSAAIHWFITRNATSLACAKRFLSNLESRFSYYFPIDPDYPFGDNTDNDYLALDIERQSVVYSLIRDQLTAEERAAAYNRLWRTTDCTPNYVGKGISYEGNAQPGSTGSAVVLQSHANAADNFYRGDTLIVFQGAGAGSSKYRIVKYIGSTRTAYLNGTIAVTPDTTSLIKIESATRIVGLTFNYGALAGATSTTATLVATGEAARAYERASLRITSGPGAGQSRTITDYNATTNVATIDTAWAIMPSASDTYEVYEPFDAPNLGIIDNTAFTGTLAAVTSSSQVTLGATASTSVGAYNNADVYHLRMTGGAAAGQELPILYYASGKITYLDGEFSPVPAANDSYLLIKISVTKYAPHGHAGLVVSSTPTTIVLDAGAGATDFTAGAVVFTSGPASGTRWDISTYVVTTRTATVITPFSTTVQPNAGDSYYIEMLGSAVSVMRVHYQVKTALLLTDPDSTKRMAVGYLASPSIRGYDGLNAGTAASITDDTQFSVNLSSAGYIRYNGAIHQGQTMKWWPAALQPASCGGLWFGRHHALRWGSPVEYRATGGSNGHDYSHNLVISESYGVLTALLAFSDDFPDLEVLASAYGTYYFDYSYQSYVYSTGFHAGGTYYGYQRVMRHHQSITHSVDNTFPSYPRTSGTAADKIRHVEFLEYQYAPFADTMSGSGFNGPVWWGTENSDTQISPNKSQLIGFVTTHLPDLRGTAAGRQHMDWLVSRVGVYETFNPETTGAIFTLWDPNEPAEPHVIKPLQQVYRDVDLTKCTNIGVGNCTEGVVMGGFFSRTAWPQSSTSTILYNFCNDWWALKTGIDHSIPECSNYRIYAGTPLLGVDTGSGGYHESAAASGSDWTSGGQIPRFGTARNITLSNPGKLVDMPRWSGSDNHAYILLDITKLYDTAVSGVRIHRHIAHLKAPGREQLVVVYDDWLTANALRHSGHLMYPQNGETGNGLGAEGSTTCPGAVDCTAANPTRLVRSVANVAVAPTSILTKVFDVTPLRFAADAANGTYSGGSGHGFRLEYCRSNDGGATCATNATTTESLIVHKIMPDQVQVSFNPQQILTGEWTGVETADNVVLFSRQGVLRTSLALQTSHPGAASYLITGISPGVYNLSRDNKLVSGSPFVISADSSSLHFTSTAGSFQLSAADAPLVIVTPPDLPNGYQFGRYNVGLTASGGTAPYTWEIKHGSTLCRRFNLRSDGQLQGTPLDADSCTFTATVSDSVGKTASRPFTLRIDLQPLEAGLFAKNTSALVKYGYPGLGPSQSCTLRIERDGLIEASLTDTGGPARRVAVFPTLPASADFQLTATCGTATLTPPVVFKTGLAPAGERRNLLHIGKPRHPAATKAEFRYGSDEPDILIGLKDCPLGCVVATPDLPLGSVFRWRMHWKDDAGQILGGGASRPVVIW